MALGDWRYRTRVPLEVQRLAEDKELGLPEWYVPSCEGIPYYPDSIREFLGKAEGRRSSGNGNGQNGAETELRVEPSEHEPRSAH